MLFISEYTDIGSTSRGSIAIPLEPPTKKQSVAVTAVSVVSAPFQTDTCIVSLLSDEDCMFDIGPSPDAMTNASKLMAGVEKVVSVPAAKGFKVAVTAADLKSIAKMDQMDNFESLIKLLAFPDQAQQHFAVMAGHVEKMNASAKSLRDATEENKVIIGQLAEAIAAASIAKAEAAKAEADVATREAALAGNVKANADKTSADKAAMDDRAKALDAREADQATSRAAMVQKLAELSSLAKDLDAREADLSERLNDAYAARNDYESRMAKLKALAG